MAELEMKWALFNGNDGLYAQLESYMHTQCSAGLHHTTHELGSVCVRACVRVCVCEFKYMEIPHSV